MNKTNRINTMMRFMNNRQHFTISQLMAEFDISRSTAIRDIHAIEELGMPLIAEYGRDGGYEIMENKLLPAVQFTDSELKALFVSFMATTNQQMPYLQDRRSITEKLLNIASQTQQDDLLELQKLLRFEHSNETQANIVELQDFAHPILMRLINQTLSGRFLSLIVDQTPLSVYVLSINQRHANWFLDAFNLDTHQKEHIAVADISDITNHAVEEGLTPDKIQTLLRKHRALPNLILKLDITAIERFNQLHLPDIVLAYTDPFKQTGYLETYIDPTSAKERNDALAWLFYLGPGIQFQSVPTELKRTFSNNWLSNL